MSDRVTRGSGVLEGFLSRRRAATALQLLEDVPASGRILDVGCGSHPLFLATCGFAERHGVDQILDGDRLVDGVRLTHYDAAAGRRLPFQEDYFHAVTMLAVFEHVDQDALTPLLREIRRVLRPGGRLVLTTPASWTEPLLRALAWLRLVSSEEIDEHKGAYDHPTISHYLEEAGFDPDRLRFGTFELGMNLWATADA